MKALLFDGPNKLRVIEQEIPQPADNEVQLRVRRVASAAVTCMATPAKVVADTRAR